MKGILKTQLIVWLFAAGYMSCTDVDVVDVYEQALNGPTSTVKVLINSEFKNGNSVTTRSTADDVNEGDTLLPIRNSFVVAYIESGGLDGFDDQDRSFSLVNIGTINLNTTQTTSRTMTVPVGNVNFLFYGNLGTSNWSGPSSLSQGSYITDISFNLTNGPRSIADSSPREYYQNPPALYYWSKTAEQKITDNPSTNQTIMLNTVHYGVGNLITVVKDATENEGKISLAGIFIGNQPKQVDWSFVPINYENNKAIIYDYNINQPGSPAAGYLPSEFPDPLTKYNINNYTLVFPTPVEQDVPISLVVKSTEDIQLNNGNLAPAGSEIHLPMVVIKAASATGTGYQIFKEDYKTIIRFTVNSLKNGDIVPQPLEEINITLDVLVDTVWKEGSIIDTDVI